MEPVFRTLELIATGLTRAQGMRLTFEGVENIPASGGAILTINHTAYTDFLAASLGVYQAGRRTRYMIKSEVMDIAIMRFLVNQTKSVPVDRSAGREAYAQAVEGLRDGEIIAMYPESTISRSFELKEFKTGAVRMAAESGRPIIPAIVWGAQRQWTKTEPKRRDMGRKHIPVTVRFGTPIVVPVDDDPETATKNLREVMTTQLHDVQDAYGDHPAGAFWVPARLGGSAPTPEEAAVIEAEEAARKAAERAERHGRDSGKG